MHNAKISSLLSFLMQLFKSIERGYSFKSSFYRIASRMLNREDYPLAYHIAIEALKNWGKVKLIATRLSHCVSDPILAFGLASLAYVLKDERLLDGLHLLLRRYRISETPQSLLDVLSTLKTLPPRERLCYNFSLPGWFIDRMIALLGHEGALSLFQALSRRTVWLRVNTLKATVEQAIRALERMGIGVEEDRDFPEVLRFTEGSLKKLATSTLVKEGLIVIQDKASVAVVHALDPRPDDMILDMCAAPGLKTTLIAQYTENRARVLAIDVSLNRSRILQRMLKVCGARNVHVAVADARKLSLSVRFDKILLDAPCSSSGAIAVDPSLRLRLERVELRHYVELQRSLLRRALSLGSEVLYSVCSLLPEEGEELIDETLDRASTVNLKIPGTYGYAGYTCSKAVRRFFPHLHHTQGFFIAKIMPIDSL